MNAAACHAARVLPRIDSDPLPSLSLPLRPHFIVPLCQGLRKQIFSRRNTELRLGKNPLRAPRLRLAGSAERPCFLSTACSPRWVLASGEFRICSVFIRLDCQNTFLLDLLSKVESTIFLTIIECVFYRGYLKLMKSISHAIETANFPKS